MQGEVEGLDLRDGTQSTAAAAQPGAGAKAVLNASRGCCETWAL